MDEAAFARVEGIIQPTVIKPNEFQVVGTLEYLSMIYVQEAADFGGVGSIIAGLQVDFLGREVDPEGSVRMSMPEGVMDSTQLVVVPLDEEGYSEFYLALSEKMSDEEPFTVAFDALTRFLYPLS